MIPTVKYLRQNGYKVRVIHRRNYNDSVISCRGGSTKVEITTPNKQDVSGESICADCDNYNKKLGVRIAIGRALSTI